jgi:hypothetical protein
MATNKERYILPDGMVVFTSLSARPEASKFGKGECKVITSTYTIDCTSNAVSWTSHGSGPIADRPSAALFGVGTWQDGLNSYDCDGISWLDSGISAIGAQVIKTTPIAAIPVTGTLACAASTVTTISGWGGKFTARTDLSFSHVKIRRLAQTTAAESDYWQTITVNVRSTDKDGAIVASGSFSATPYATSFNDVLVELWSAGIPKTLTKADLGDTYWVEYAATNRDGGRSPLGFSDTTVAPTNQVLPALGTNTGYQLKSNGA